MSAHRIFAAVTKSDLADLREVIRDDPASVNARDESGLPPLYTAALYMNHEAVALLLAAGAELDIFACSYLERNDAGRRLLENDPGLVNATTRSGRTPLHFAAEKGMPPSRERWSNSELT